jgi:hypothetical protein
MEYSELSFVWVCEAEPARSLFDLRGLAPSPSPEDLRGLLIVDYDGALRELEIARQSLPGED